MARQRVDSVNVGGGVSLWPDMESMRLSYEEMVRLAGLCIGLAVAITAVFCCLHGMKQFLTWMVAWVGVLQPF